MTSPALSSFLTSAYDQAVLDELIAEFNPDDVASFGSGAVEDVTDALATYLNHVGISCVQTALKRLGQQAQTDLLAYIHEPRNRLSLYFAALAQILEREDIKLASLTATNNTTASKDDIEDQSELVELISRKWQTMVQCLISLIAIDFYSFA